MCIRDRSRSLASLKRAKQKENRDINKKDTQENFKPVKRNVNIPESITVRDLANRMAEQSSSLIKHLLGMGVTVTINQSLAADTAEYLVKEFGHNPIRETKAEEIIQKIKDSRIFNFLNYFLCLGFSYWVMTKLFNQIFSSISCKTLINCYCNTHTK
mgnify:CR=1 FL=1